MATPFKRDEIPYTQSRLKSLIKVFATYGGYAPDPNDPTNLPTLSSMQLIGSITKVDIKTTRQAAERRELNFDNAAEILEMVPGLASFEVSMNYVMLYRASFIEALGFGGHELRYWTRPVLFALQLPSPVPASLPPKTILLRDCWGLDNPMMFDVEAKDDLRIIQEVPIACGGMIEIQGA